MNDPQKIWSFDIDTRSVGFANRGYLNDPNHFSEVDVLLTPDDFASAADESWAQMF